MAAYRPVYDSRYLQADCQKPGSAPEPYALQSSMGYLYLFTFPTTHSKTVRQKCKRSTEKQFHRKLLDISRREIKIPQTPFTIL